MIPLFLVSSTVVSPVIFFLWVAGQVIFASIALFQVRGPMPPVYFFLIDVSMNAVQTGATAAACSAISQVISDLPVSLCLFAYGYGIYYLIVRIYKKIFFIVVFLKVLTDVLMVILLQEGPQTMVGIATFDSTIHFYCLKRALRQVSYC
jgi:protein transport protein SEC24